MTGIKNWKPPNQLPKLQAPFIRESGCKAMLPQMEIEKASIAKLTAKRNSSKIPMLILL
jgi:hypothetical protein